MASSFRLPEERRRALQSLHRDALGDELDDRDADVIGTCLLDLFALMVRVRARILRSMTLPPAAGLA